MGKESAEKELEAYLDRLKVGDLLEASHLARKKGMGRLEDQGIAALALFISELLTETLERATPSDAPKTSSR